MPNPISIGLIGDFDAAVLAHRAIPLALQAAAGSLHAEVTFEWVPTDQIHGTDRIAHFDALWCVPASPYRNMDGALLAIRHARENGVPFLGTCGGFQHAVVEYARNVLGWADAEHAETAPGAARAVISPLACALVEATEAVRLVPGTRIAAAYGALRITEGYRCRYGLNPDFQAALVAGPLRAAADDATGEVRAVELDGHPFFVATLFQPERAALRGEPAPLVAAFVAAGVAAGEARKRARQ
jgi:CTP synthase (UTP-ammonia lyase)